MSNGLLMTVKFQKLHCANETDLDSHIVSFAVAMKYTKDVYREASSKPQNLCSFSSAILFSPFSHGFVNSFQASQFAQQNNRYNQE